MDGEDKKILSSALEELEADFIAAVRKIDFKKYDSSSFDFRRAKCIGDMWLVIRTVLHGGTDRDEHEGVTGEIDGEIAGAERYMALYRETGEAPYREMAGDELRHAGYLIAMARRHGGDTDALDRLDARRISMAQ